MTESDKKKLIEFCDFEIIEEDKKYRLIDIQEANLGGIEEETFNNLDEIVNRLEVYISDIFFYG
jgi:hypothetical protein